MFYVPCSKPIIINQLINDIYLFIVIQYNQGQKGRQNFIFFCFLVKNIT